MRSRALNPRSTAAPESAEYRGARIRGVPRRPNPRSTAAPESAEYRGAPCRSNMNTAENMIYLDWAASAPPEPSAMDEGREAALRYFANPSAPHAAGRQAGEKLAEARGKFAALLEWTRGKSSLPRAEPSRTARSSSRCWTGTGWAAWNGRRRGS